ncbi:MAG: hypothetical protein CMP06_13255 [Xanthomonadales bacterium]|nr:hypothetical protein [Xanthomonadales bacterium]
MMRLVACLLVLCALSPALAAEEREFIGYGYTLEGDEFRYIEHHRQMLDNAGTVTAWKVDFWDASGEKIAEKRFIPGNNPSVPGYDFKMLTTGYREGIENVDGPNIILYRQKPDEDSKTTKKLEPRSQACADSGFDQYVREHWDTLQSGERLKFQFIAAGRLSAYAFRAEKTGESSFEGQPAMDLKVALDSVFGVFVDPLRLTYSLDSQQLLEYRGIGNMQNADGKVYPVRVSYYSETPSEAKAAVAAARGNKPAE